MFNNIMKIFIPPKKKKNAIQLLVLVSSTIYNTSTL
jgi:hypothetical protein